jgi:hypothetical protein
MLDVALPWERGGVTRECTASYVGTAGYTTARVNRLDLCYRQNQRLCTKDNIKIVLCFSETT